MHVAVQQIIGMDFAIPRGQVNLERYLIMCSWNCCSYSTEALHNKIKVNDCCPTSIKQHFMLAFHTDIRLTVTMSTMHTLLLPMLCFQRLSTLVNCSAARYTSGPDSYLDYACTCIHACLQCNALIVKIGHHHDHISRLVGPHGRYRHVKAHGSVVMQDGAVGWLAVFPGPVGPLLAHRSQQLLAPADRLALPCPHQVPQVMLLQGVEC